jgi:hypothetical protein
VRGAEVAAAALVGVLSLAWVLEPLLHPVGAPAFDDEPPDPEETPRGVALAALKEIEFDRATGKLSDADYEHLKARYTANALAVLRTESRGSDDAIEGTLGAAAPLTRGGHLPRCAGCGPRPEPDAVFCSSCGLRLAA